ncbi:MAG: hypothetical protein AMJ46_05655 [Latescibacteria bacterium DG_63]|nr:MAG: hypothetical protein AMJ46_05655 [Latescibacteria bacterium DG_63]
MCKLAHLSKSFVSKTNDHATYNKHELIGRGEYARGNVQISRLPGDRKETLDPIQSRQPVGDLCHFKDNGKGCPKLED